MEIFFAILKVLGLIILIALAVFLLIVALVLFAPVRYKVLAEFNNDVKVSLRVRWLAGILYYRKDFCGENSDRLRIFGIPFGIKKAKKRKTKINEADAKVQAEKVKNENVDSDSQENNQICEKSEIKRNSRKAKTGNKKQKTINHKINKKVSVFTTISDIINAVRDENNKRLLSFFETIVFKLFKHAKPRNIKADMVIGLEDPADTGMLFGAIAIARGFVEGKYNIYPNFEEKILEGKLKAKGRIMVAVLLYYLLKIYGNDDVKLIIKKGWAR